ncbi:hypothetical protein KL933_000913 [Ogataea haglerorum]|uniref:Altered inheritance of mitochondria protein 23, mitochondrial n=1 Tax=Ogataea haglerorum TaxID=1937702 RepID=A0AAN6I2L1_9ASCO|nr:uncharacterized protein KL911_001573 [Ogataea haglerorum]KAG7729833.1 hypothetical protein KL933_000913 [Ogataea haglerorum]KAG7732739.1 hypothetical protein KL948_002169 [Ogataea haglerorum]KAG7755516.1 hypothetical protein KL911_001573 [Ogataea haglerorum]KAG7760195.1 hypothetical protein KL947_001039 [Ogataea haglerorum]
MLRALTRQFSVFRSRSAMPQRDSVRLRSLGGTAKDQDTLKLVFEKSREVNPKGLVQIIRKGENLGVMNFRTALAQIDLSKEGFLFMGSVRDQKFGDVGLLKVASPQKARKQLTKHLQQQKTQQLQEENPRLIAKQQKQENRQKEPDVKMVRVSWQITLHDLTSQKRHEVETQVKKGERIRIVVDDKDNFDADVRVAGDEKSLTELEATKRGKIESFLDELLEELGAEFHKEGEIYDKVSYDVKAQERKNELSPEEKKRLKLLKKQEKQEKLRQRTEEKRRKAQEEIRILTVD